MADEEKTQKTPKLIAVEDVAGFKAGEEIPPDSVYYIHDAGVMVHQGKARWESPDPPKGGGSIPY